MLFFRTMVALVRGGGGVGVRVGLPPCVALRLVVTPPPSPRRCRAVLILPQPPAHGENHTPAMFMCLYRFIDDGLILHRVSDSDAPEAVLKNTYPMELPFESEALCQTASITFLDVRFISVQPLVSDVFWKPTHACAHIYPGAPAAQGIFARAGFGANQ